MDKSAERIYLTGYRGTGKTTVGKLISGRLATECVDLDETIETAAGQSIRELFDQGGEPLFRDWETKCLRQTIDDPESPRVISLGGGAILRKENREMIRRSGVCVWLTASAEVIAQRVFGDESSAQRRPALTELSPVDEIRELLAKREPLYREAADLILPTDDSPPEVLADQICRWLKENGYA